VKWDDKQKVPYACNGNQFVGYDDVQSIIHKVRNMKRKSIICEFKHQQRNLQDVKLSKHMELSLQNICFKLHTMTHLL
jgi:flagellar biosynthesis component FlhA